MQIRIFEDRTEIREAGKIETFRPDKIEIIVGNLSYDIMEVVKNLIK